jgi:hypothetical protein
MSVLGASLRLMPVPERARQTRNGYLGRRRALNSSARACTIEQKGELTYRSDKLNAYTIVLKLLPVAYSYVDLSVSS